MEVTTSYQNQPLLSSSSSLTMSCQETDNANVVENDDSNDKIPRIGMKFSSEQEAYDFYNAYARATGFSARRDMAHGKPIYYRKFCCSCAGKKVKDKRDVNYKSQRPETRFNCKAHMIVNSRLTGKFEVTKFLEDHSGHSLVSPVKVHLLRSQRKITPIQAAEIDNFDKSGIAPKAGLTYISEQAGGRDKVGYVLQDLKNYLRSKRTMPMKEGDAGGILNYLQTKQSEDPNFYNAIQVDEDDLMTNIFWTDGQMQVDYIHFGEVVSFDTTYRKNSEGRPFALFVGVNHHRQTVVFGGAFLYDETIDTFKWLFNAFEEAMGGKKPVTIFTDQDAAMLTAIGETWPEVNHRLCIWHIYQNAASNIGHVFGNFPGFLNDFKYIIYNYEEEEDFINLWNDMLDKYGLRDNDWLQELYKKKEKWALVYGRQHFSANILSRQRSESMNSALKGYVNCKQNLLRFFENFERLVDERRYEELKADFRTNQSEIQLDYAPEILKHAREVYTHDVFKLFQKELSRQHDARLECLSELDGIYQYKITPYQKTYHHTVTYAISDDKISCSCKKFEFAGILCFHALKVFTLHNVFRIPEIYIKKRWTKGAKRGLVEGFSQPLTTSSTDSEKGKEVNGITIYVDKYKELCRIFSQLSTKAARDDDAFELAKSIGFKGLERVDALFESKEIKKPSAAPTSCVVKNMLVSKVTKTKTATSLDFDNHVIEPVERMDGATETREKSSDVVIRGLKVKKNSKVKSGKRLKGGLEQAISKRKPKNYKTSSSQKPSTVDIRENNIHNSNLGTSALNAESLVQPLSCPSMLSFPQVPQNNQVSQPIWTSPHLQGAPSFPFGQAFAYFPPSQTELVNPQIPGRSNYYSPYVSSNQPNNSTSMIGLLQTQMLQAQRPLQTQMLQAQGPGLRSEEFQHVNDEDNSAS